MDAQDCYWQGREYQERKAREELDRCINEYYAHLEQQEKRV